MNDATDAEENDPKREVDDEILADALFEENDDGWKEDGEDVMSGTLIVEVGS